MLEAIVAAVVLVFAGACFGFAFGERQSLARPVVPPAPPPLWTGDLIVHRVRDGLPDVYCAPFTFTVGSDLSVLNKDGSELVRLTRVGSEQIEVRAWTFGWSRV